MPALKLFLILVAILVPMSNVGYASITILTNSFEAYAGYEEDEALWLSTRTVPFHAYGEAVGEGSYSKNTIDFSYDGKTTVLQYDFEHRRSGSLDAFAQSLEMDFLFTANSDAVYVLSGYYDVTDINATDSGSVFQQGTLWDLTENKGLFSGFQSSYHTSNERFELGGTRGDYESVIFPGSSLRGNLIAGHVYSLLIVASTIARDDPDSGITAVGNFTLRIVQVPEPATAIMCAILSMFLSARRAKRR
jgi:hypothetical protein